MYKHTYHKLTPKLVNLIIEKKRVIPESIRFSKYGYVEISYEHQIIIIVEHITKQKKLSCTITIYYFSDKGLFLNSLTHSVFQGGIENIKELKILIKILGL